MKFDESYTLLEDMLEDSSFPKKLTGKLKHQLQQVISMLEQGKPSLEKIQAAFDRMTQGVNPLVAECPDAAEIVAADVLYILDWFELNLTVEEALRKRNW